MVAIHLSVCYNESYILMIGDDNMTETKTVATLNELATGIKTLYDVITDLRTKNVRLIVTDCNLYHVARAIIITITIIGISRIFRTIIICI